MASIQDRRKTMRIFLTGAAGFIGTATTRELIAHGHQVVGLARSDANAEALKALGAEVHRGSLEDLESLKAGAMQTDGTIHCAFIHDFAKFAENGQIDKRAIEAMGDALEGSGKPFIVTSGTGLVAPNVVVTEDMRRDASPHVPRVSEQAGLAYAKRGVRAMAIRLPQVFCWKACAAKAPPPMSAMAARAGRRGIGWMSPASIAWRWRRAPRTASITASAKRACQCSRSWR
jgi:nucleoside-diphosphate-sugar epimerase